MKNNYEDLKLLNAALADETWESFQARLRTQTTATLRSSKRHRALFTLSAQLAVLLALIAAAWSSFTPRTRPSFSNQSQATSESRLQASVPSSSPNTTPYITQDQMLALFPTNTCVLAEINGQTELVFFDSSKARDGFDTRRVSN